MKLLIGLIVIPLGLAVAAIFGYLFGSLLAITPLVGDLLEIPGVQTATIMAWIYVMALVTALATREDGGR